MISNNIKKVEFQISKKNYHIDFYDYCDIYDSEIQTLYENFKNNKKDLQTFFIEEENYLKKFNLEFNYFIKDEFEYISLILSILILKSFTDMKNINYNQDVLNHKSGHNPFESDNIINTTIHNFDSFKT
jgi:hypothetical protein